MAVYSTNQARQLYVAKELKTGNQLLPTDAVGSILPKADTAKNHMYLEYMGAGGMTRTDLIDLKTVMYAKATSSKALAHPLALHHVVLDPDVNTGAPVAGQDYILRLFFRHYVGQSEEDTYVKYGMVHAGVGMNASNFYKTLALSLVKNMSRDDVPLVKVYLTTASTSVEVTNATKESDLTGTYTGLNLEEVEQKWVLGTMPVAYIPFTVQFVTVLVDGDDVIWGKVTKIASTNSVEDGKEIADLEYFCMGERGDIYRGVGFPNIIRTTYLVDPSKKYDTLDIHFAYVGSNESVQKSEKDLTIVAEDDGSHTLMNALITAINTASGLNITKLT
jgi:hypothetical protein